jgi:Glyoxalase/Bleomycin resistance protein/Dioxygenase superfamily
MIEFRGVFHHIGLACDRIEAEIESLALIGYANEGPPVEDPIQRVRLQFFSASGGSPRLELIEPTTPDSPVRGILRRGTKFYHLAYEVPHLDDSISLLETNEFRCLAPPAPAVAFGMRRIVFMISPTLTLLELIDASAFRP